ncbi:hypothetical protein H257_05658 [Aphanomyces astaci]|uniref:Uncharacterized protein n=1 Tax=Aphanomyces astaci TaxID=112090 RepID=W4GQ88_APHAT|nr:hypothetical protein H257_05658 [Aphanomyces astaci]ETV81038.1 hypothetical protein H257_05658 [Aphanomyces astaci]|eukprot:XP_009828896.1 hypothetical protein H257_05658 [Aphanomyces astaci]
MSNSPSSPSSSVGITDASSSMSVPLPSPSMEAAGSMVLSPYQGMQGYTSATPAFTPLASPLTHPSPGPSSSQVYSASGAGSKHTSSAEDDLSLKLSSIMKALDACVYLVRNFNGDQQVQMQKAVHTYVQRLAELNLHLQHMPLNHVRPFMMFEPTGRVPSGHSAGPDGLSGQSTHGEPRDMDVKATGTVCSGRSGLAGKATGAAVVAPGAPHRPRPRSLRGDKSHTVLSSQFKIQNTNQVANQIHSSTIST